MFCGTTWVKFKLCDVLFLPQLISYTNPNFNYFMILKKDGRFYKQFIIKYIG